MAKQGEKKRALISISLISLNIRNQTRRYPINRSHAESIHTGKRKPKTTTVPKGLKPSAGAKIVLGPQYQLIQSAKWTAPSQSALLFAAVEIASLFCTTSWYDILHCFLGLGSYLYYLNRALWRANQVCDFYRPSLRGTYIHYVRALGSGHASPFRYELGSGSGLWLGSRSPELGVRSSGFGIPSIFIS